MARTNNKEIILKEAFRLFLSKGYDAVSFADLVKATNISRGGMFHHFKGKEDIFNQVADRFVFNFFREGESFIESPKSATPLKDFLAHCTKIIGERMLHFSETLGASVTAASFMSFILYLKEHYASWQEKIQEYEEQEVKTWNEVIELAKKKREIREDIERMPLNYQTELTSDGAGISGGQRQRIALARALLTDAPVLILDEATSSLDILTEKRIVDNLMALDKTLLFIAHRLTIAERTEKVVVLDQGKIVEEGTHADLLAQDGFYAHLVNS